MTVWCDSREEFVALSDGALTEMQAIVEPALLARENVKGYCRACRRQTTFHVGPPPAKNDWKNLREGLVCACGFTSRMRMTLKVLDELLTRCEVRQAAVLERVSPLFPYLEARVPGLIGCEYLGPEVRPGNIVRLHGLPTRNENMMAFTFADGSLDLLMHFDVLEHVPDARVGLREAHRVLAEGGVMMFTCPFFHRLERNMVRAQVAADGQIEYLMVKAFHGNPLSGKGSLVYIHPSLELFDMLYEAGFERVQAAISYDPLEGIVSNGCPFPEEQMWPIAFLAWK